MTRFLQIYIVVIFTLFFDKTNSKPFFEEINIERNFKIGYKPLKFRPITFIKEKWGPFGRFGRKHTIERRDLDDMNIIDKGEEMNPHKPLVITINRAIPVVENIEELVAAPTYRPLVHAISPPSAAPPSSVLNTDISPAIPSNPYFTPIGIPLNNVAANPVPVVEAKPVDVPLFVPAKIIVEQQSGSSPSSPPSPVDPPPTTPLPPTIPPPRTSLMGFIGELLSELMARLIARARATIGQLGTPPVQQ